MKGSFQKNLAAYKASQQNSASHQIEQSSPTKISDNSDFIRERHDWSCKLTELKNANSVLQTKLASAENNHKNALSLEHQTQDEISKLKTENKKLHDIVNQQKAHIEAMVQNSKNIEYEDKSKVQELEKSLIEKDKDLSAKDGMIKGLQEAVKVISSANGSSNNSPLPKLKHFSPENSPVFKIEESSLGNSKQLQKTNLLLGIDDILTEKSQIVESNPQSMLLGEMCDKSTIQVSEDDF
jgi:predicted RNase H-like nuclease (RuvC/YqgF family)